MMFPPGAQRHNTPNGIRLRALDAGGAVVEERTFFSIGGGFIAEDGVAQSVQDRNQDQEKIPYPFHSAAELLETARTHSLSIDQVMMANECARVRALDPNANVEAQAERVRSGVASLWQTMRDCVERGIAAEGISAGRPRGAKARASIG